MRLGVVLALGVGLAACGTQETHGLGDGGAEVHPASDAPAFGDGAAGPDGGHADASALHGDAAPIHGDASPEHGDASPEHGDASPEHGDASPEHADASSDDAQADAGPACGFGTAPASLEVNLRHTDAGVPRHLSGAARATMGTYLEVRFASGDGFAFARPPPFTLPADRDVHVTLEAVRPWWLELAVVVRELRADGSAGDLIAAFWQLSQLRAQPGTLPELPVIAGVDLAYQRESCAPVPERCAPAVTNALVVTSTSGTLTVGARAEGALGGLRAGNGRSLTYVGRLLCSDTPTSWYTGWVARR